eukprot:scaffold43335_cov23-Tisochrysis_lutea.AAC.3
MSHHVLIRGARQSSRLPLCVAPCRPLLEALALVRDTRASQVGKALEKSVSGSTERRTVRAQERGYLGQRSKAFLNCMPIKCAHRAAILRSSPG